MPDANHDSGGLTQPARPEIAMPTPTASLLSSHRGLARRRCARRWWALSASGFLVCASLVLADDDTEPADSTAGDPRPANLQEIHQPPGDESPNPAQETQSQSEALVVALRTKLDAVEAEKARLSLQLELLNRKQADLEAQARELRQVQRQLQHSQTATERAEAQAEALRTEIEQLKQQRELATQHHTAQLTAAELRLREHKDRLGGVDARLQRLEQQLAQREAQVARLEAADARRADAKQLLEARIAELRARLPAPEGGSVTVAEARARAQQDAEALKRLIREGQGVRNPQLWQQVRATENALHRSQYLLARTQGHLTVYRVRPGDSLAHISAMVYGDDQAWSRIFEANRHLLDEPDQVLPGLTLVIPE